jgi:7,8-dihydro-6-hydroxymethylpterin-pyrophosphokinase
MSLTIAADVRLVNVVDVALNLENHAGKVRGTRKNPHVIDVGFGRD